MKFKWSLYVFVMFLALKGRVGMSLVSFSKVVTYVDIC